MRNKNRKYALKGFTIAELLVVMVLTSVSITLSYGTLTYVQKLFYEYKKQNKFLNEFTSLKNRLDLESLKADLVTESSTDHFEIKRDSTLGYLEILQDLILVKRNNVCDTFHIKATNIQKEYEKMNHPLWQNRIVRSIKFEVLFSKQKFNFSFHKEHSPALKLELELQQ